MIEIKFRNERYSGSGIRDAYEILFHEMYELNNIDIPDTLVKTIFKHHYTARKYTEKIISLIGKEDITEDTAKVWVATILHFVKEITGKNIEYALWLTDMNEAMYTIYGIDKGYLEQYDYIDAYKVGPVILSDLGKQGILYGYEELPVIHSKIAVTDTRNEEFGGDTMSIYTSIS